MQTDGQTDRQTCKREYKVCTPKDEQRIGRKAKQTGWRYRQTGCRYRQTGWRYRQTGWIYRQM